MKLTEQHISKVIKSVLNEERRKYNYIKDFNWVNYLEFLVQPEISPLYKKHPFPKLKILFIQILLECIYKTDYKNYNPSQNSKFYKYIFEQLLKYYPPTMDRKNIYLNMTKLNSDIFSYNVPHSILRNTIHDYIEYTKFNPQNPIDQEIDTMFKELSENKLVDRLVNNVLNEMKGDNLHQFIEYILHYGKEGNLISNLTKDEVCNMLCKGAEQFNSYSQHDLNEDFSYWLHYNYDMDLDDITADYDNLQEQYWDEFIDGIEEDLCNDIFPNLQFNKNNLIYIERNITIPYFSENTNAFIKLQQEFDGHLGECWSYKYGQVIDGRTGNEISLKGYVKPEDVNWVLTATLNFDIPDEYELRLDYNTPILLTEITAVTRKREIPIWKGNLIFQA